MLISEPIVKDLYLIQSNETTLRALDNWTTANDHTEWIPLYPNGGSIGSASDEMVIVMRAAFLDPMIERVTTLKAGAQTATAQTGSTVTGKVLKLLQHSTHSGKSTTTY